MTGRNPVTMKIARSNLLIGKCKSYPSLEFLCTDKFQQWKPHSILQIGNNSIFCEVGSIISRLYAKIGWMKVLIKYIDVIGSNPFWPLNGKQHVLLLLYSNLLSHFRSHIVTITITYCNHSKASLFRSNRLKERKA
jgi:hypothetical protein